MSRWGPASQVEVHGDGQRQLSAERVFSAFERGLVPRFAIGPDLGVFPRGPRARALSPGRVKVAYSLPLRIAPDLGGSFSGDYAAVVSCNVTYPAGTYFADWRISGARPQSSSPPTHMVPVDFSVVGRSLGMKSPFVSLNWQALDIQDLVTGAYQCITGSSITDLNGVVKIEVPVTPKFSAAGRKWGVFGLFGQAKLGPLEVGRLGTSSDSPAIMIYYGDSWSSELFRELGFIS